MNDPFAKIFLRWGLLLAMIWISGCAATHQTTASPTTDPTVTVTITVPSFPTATIATSTPQATPTPTLPQPNVTTAAGKASFLSENYPDNSVLKPGEKFVKTFKIKNTGSITWTTAYSFVLDPAHQNETLGSPAQINLPQDVPPGSDVSLSIPLNAPTTPGTYTVYWAFKNEGGGTILIDGGPQVWVKIIVCDPNQPCNPPVGGGGSSVTANGVTASLTGFTSDSSSASVSFCMTLPNRDYGPAGSSVSLKIDQQTVLASIGGTLNSGCFEFDFPVGVAELNQAQHITVSISQVRILGGLNDPNEACQTAQSKLMSQYPGLGFKCSFSMGGYFTNLQLPAGMSATQAQQIITDAIEGAINGPWVLNVK